MFFEPFPKIDYEINGESHLLTNIVITNMLKRKEIDKHYSFKVYQNTKNKSLASIAYELYGNSEYWWTILIANELISPYNLNFNRMKVRQYCEEKYGKNKSNSIHHYYNSRDKRIVDDLDTIRYNSGEKVPHYINIITNYDYESTKLLGVDIYYISPSYIETFIENYRNEIKGN